MPGCKPELPQADATWLEAIRGFTLPIIAAAVFMDVGFLLVYTAQFTASGKAKASHSTYKATHPPGAHQLHNQTHPQEQIWVGFQT